MTPILERPNLLVNTIYIALLFAAFALAAGNDLQEEQRLSMEGYVAERVADHHAWTTRSDSVQPVSAYGERYFPRLQVRTCP